MPLRSLGVPAAAIVDFDVLMDQNFAKLWPLLNEEPEVRRPIELRRDVIAKKMEVATRERCKQYGVLALEEADRKDAQDLITEFSKYGLFIVDIGELECWLTGVNGISRIADKSRWLVNTFEAMGSDPSTPQFVGPSEDNVWSFMACAKQWIDNPARKGIPD